MLGNAGLPPVSELLSRILLQIIDTIEAARDVLIEKERFAQLSQYLEKIAQFLAELQKKGVPDLPTIKVAFESLENHLGHAKELVQTCCTKSRFYLLINCRSLTKQLQQITNEIGKALRLIPLTSLDLSMDIMDKSNDLFQEMEAAQFKADVAAEEIAVQIETGLRDRRKSSNFANNLVVQIAKAVGVGVDPVSLKKELEEFKKEKEAAESQKKQAEALQLQQVVSLLDWADAANSSGEREKQYRDKRVSLGPHPFPALQSFYCPITQDVMDDPVDVATGHTFERSAIEKWFADGHNVCPVTSVELDNLNLKPNLILKRSIDEWKERNIVSQLTSMATKLTSEDEEIVAAALLELYWLCEERTLHRHWVAAEGLIPVLVNLLKSSKSNIRKKALATLNLLVKDNIHNKIRACEAGVLTVAVHSLARDMAESRQAVALLLQLSKERKLCQQMSKVQGCILLLVTITNSEIPQAAEDAQLVLENLSDNDQNVVLMAEANYFKPLVQGVKEGSIMTQILMANTVSRMELTDQNRGELLHLGIVPSLVKMASQENLGSKSAALGALQNLSKLSESRNPLVDAGVLQPILELILSAGSGLMILKEQAAVILANLAVATTLSDCACDGLVRILESSGTIHQLLSVLTLTGPSIQSQLLRALNGICCLPSAKGTRMTMREAGSIDLLVGFCLLDSDSDVRFYAFKLLHSLTQDGGGDALLKRMGKECLEFFVKLLQFSSNVDEKTAIMGILNNIPKDNKHMSGMMLEAGLLPIIFEILKRSVNTVLIKKELLECTAGVLLRFTLPSDLPLQLLTAEYDVVNVLLQLLNSGTPLTKCRAATSLGQLSESTSKLSCPVGKKACLCCFSPLQEESCKIHGGFCSSKGTFCLLEAEAIPILLQTLEEKEEAADEAALGALATLLYDEFWEKGAEAIAEAGGIDSIVSLLTAGTSRVKENAVWILEKFFRKDQYKLMYGRVAQMPLISLTQDGTSQTRCYAARILAHLNILHEEESYF